MSILKLYRQIVCWLENRLLFTDCTWLTDWLDWLTWLADLLDWVAWLTNLSFAHFCRFLKVINDCSYIQISRHSNILTFPSPDIQIYSHSNVLTFKYKDIQMSWHSKVIAFKYQDILMSWHSNMKTFKCPGIEKSYILISYSVSVRRFVSIVLKLKPP